MEILGLSCLVLAFCLSLCLGCSPPQGWRPQEFPLRALDADLVILGQIEKNMTRKIPGRIRDTDVEYVLETNVKCVLKNPSQLDIPNIISIIEEPVRSSGRCVDSMVSVKYGEDIIILIRERMTEPGGSPSDAAEFEFSTVNVQGPIGGIEELADVISQEGFDNMLTPSGDQCDSNRTGSPANKQTFNISVILLCLITMLSFT
jgi:hypothetical protein